MHMKKKVTFQFSGEHGVNNGNKKGRWCPILHHGKVSPLRARRGGMNSSHLGFHCFSSRLSTVLLFESHAHTYHCAPVSCGDCGFLDTHDDSFPSISICVCVSYALFPRMAGLFSFSFSFASSVTRSIRIAYGGN